MAKPSPHPVKPIAGALKARCGITTGSHILVAVSAGPDSVALLRALHHLAPKRRWNLKLTVAHVHHHLRPCADDDARFTADLAAQLDLPYIRRDIHPARQPDNLEAAARRARYRALADAARQACAAAVATAHHANDQLETLIMRFLRGSSFLGLSAIPWTRPLTQDPPIRLIRPMLNVTRTQVLDYLADLSQPHRTDPTNADTNLLRNRIRHDLLPALDQIDPNAPRRATRSANLVQQHQQLLDHAVRQALDNITTDNGTTHLNRHFARSLPAQGLVLAAVLRRILTAAGVPADTLTSNTLTPITRAVRDQTGGHRRFNLANAIQLELTRNDVIVRKSDPAPKSPSASSPAASARPPRAS